MNKTCKLYPDRKCDPVNCLLTASTALSATEARSENGQSLKDLVDICQAKNSTVMDISEKMHDCAIKTVTGRYSWCKKIYKENIKLMVDDGSENE